MVGFATLVCRLKGGCHTFSMRTTTFGESRIVSHVFLGWQIGKSRGDTEFDRCLIDVEHDSLLLGIFLMTSRYDLTGIMVEESSSYDPDLNGL